MTRSDPIDGPSTTLALILLLAAFVTTLADRPVANQITQIYEDYCHADSQKEGN